MTEFTLTGRADTGFAQQQRDKAESGFPSEPLVGNRLPRDRDDFCKSLK